MYALKDLVDPTRS